MYGEQEIMLKLRRILDPFLPIFWSKIYLKLSQSSLRQLRV